MADLQKIKELRTRTSASIEQCRSALDRADGDIVRALEILGARVPRNPEDRVLNQGVVHTYNHGDRIAVIVEVSCETDFVARTEAFLEFTNAVAMQVAATNPRYLDEEDRGWAPCVEEGPTDVLMNQPWVYDEHRTIGNLLNTLKIKVGEEIRVTKAVRIERGVGMTVLPNQAPRG
jgi:elongation factor Ts